jgi:hypothetical protein
MVPANYIGGILTLCFRETVPSRETMAGDIESTVGRLSHQAPTRLPMTMIRAISVSPI